MTSRVGQASIFVFPKMYRSIFSSILSLTMSTLLAQIQLLPGTQMTIAGGTTVQIETDQQVLEVASGSALQNDGTIVFGPNSSVVEYPDWPIFGSGTERIDRLIGGPLVEENAGNLGCGITTSASVDTLTVIRGHSFFLNDQMEPSVLRWFEVRSTPVITIPADVYFKYDGTELNGISESDLAVSNSSNNGAFWNAALSSVDINTNSVEALGVDSIGTLTLFPSLLNATTEVMNGPIGPLLKLYPNPATDGFTIEIPNQREKLQKVAVTDLEGKVYYESSIAEVSGPLMDIQLIAPAGIYTVTVIGRSTEWNGRIIIMK